MAMQVAAGLISMATLLILGYMVLIGVIGFSSQVQIILILLVLIWWFTRR